MSPKNMIKTRHFALVVSISLIGLMLIWAGCKGKSEQPAEPEGNAGSTNAVSAAQDQPAKTTTDTPESTGKSLFDVVKAARYWGPTFNNWQGKTAPDFTLTDLEGKEHKLSSYRGKDVILVFWATWCPPCRMEIPHLVKLRKESSPDKLVILGVSSITPRNTAEMIADFVKQNATMNYPVLPAQENALPAPYNQVNSIPCSFFVNREGKIKLATAGLMSEEEIKAILEAS